MFKIGLTGGMGSGKSTVAGVFRVLGIPVFEADAEAKGLMQDDARLRDALAARFGPEVFPNGVLDRALLANKVFGNEVEVAALNALVHPAVRRAFATWADEQRVPYVIMEAALMAENEGYRAFDRVVTVACPEELRVTRAAERDGVGAEAIQSRMRHQASDDQRAAIAHFVINNDGSELVIPQVLAVHEQLLNLAAQ